MPSSSFMRVQDFGALSPKCDVCFKLLLSRLGNLCIRARASGQLQENSIFKIHQDWKTRELTETVITCTSPIQVQTRQSSSTEKGKWTQIPMSNQEATCHWYLLGKENQFAPMECHWVYPTLHGRPTQEHHVFVLMCVGMYVCAFSSGILKEREHTDKHKLDG